MKNYLFLAIQLLATLAYSQKYYVNEDFNNSTLPSGWTNNAVSGTQVWNFGINGASAHQGNQNINGSPMAYFDDDNLGGSSLNNTVELTTPTFDNSAAPYSYLSFQYNFREFGQANDAFYIDVYDGSQWQRVFTRTVDDCGNYNSWICINNFPSARIDISAYANANCQVRFTYHDGNDWGWYVGLDDVEIWSPYANDLSVIDVKSPKSSCGLSTADSIKVLISNQGYLTQQNFNIAFELDVSPAVVENITDSIAYQDSLIYTFSNTGNFSRIGLHNLKVYTTLPNDSNLANDSLSIQISNDSIYQLPYFNDFESTNNGWSTSGTNTSWEWGVPTGSVIDSAYSGQNAWVTNLNGTYNRSEFSYLLSPCFDFSNETADPIISFYLNYITELNYDKVWLESSIDNEQTWQKVNSTTFANNWYNIANRQTWERASNGWVKATNVLGNLAGEPRVKLRFVFESDGGTQLEGVGIDDISIFKRGYKDLSLAKLYYPSDSLICGLGSTERIGINLTNLGLESIDTFTVFYQIDSLPLESENIITNIDTFNTLTHFSQTTFDFSQIKSYKIKTWIYVKNDSYRTNDTITMTLNNQTSYSSDTIPYVETFDQFLVGAPNQLNWQTLPIASSQVQNGWYIQSASSGQNDHTSSFGNYIVLNQNQSNEATLETPCINFSNSNGVMLSFWTLYKSLPTFVDLYLDYYIDGEWVVYDTIQSNAFSENWKFHEVFAPIKGISSKLRFRVNTSCCAEKLLIDDIQVKPANIKIQKVNNQNLCNTANMLPIELTIKNNSLVDIPSDSMFVEYRINGSQPIIDTISRIVKSNSLVTYLLKDSLDLLQLPNKFEINFSIKYTDSINHFKDSNTFLYYNSQKATHLSEDFENSSSNSYDSLMWKLDKSWRVIDAKINKEVNLNLNNKTPGGSKYILNHVDGESTLTSNCINLNSNDSLYLSFWYNVRYHLGPKPFKIVLYTSNNISSFQVVDTIHINNFQNNDWSKLTYNLTPYLSSNTIQVRIKIISSTQHIAIDDIELVKKKFPLNLRAIDLEVFNNCDNSNSTINLSVENNGVDSLSLMKFYTYYQLNSSTIIIDSITTNLEVGQHFAQQFNTSANLTSSTSIQAWVKMPGDSIKSDDTMRQFYTPIPNSSGIHEDFETFEDNVCNYNSLDQMKNGWYSPNNTWGVNNSLKCRISHAPIYDHTIDSGTYISSEPNFNTANLNKYSILISPCIDISTMNQPVLNLWFHAFANDTLLVEIKQNTNWFVIDSILGQQSSYLSPWQSESIDISSFKSSRPIQFRFKFFNRSIFRKFSLDDISITDSLITSRPENISEVENYHLYPNPSQGQFTLEVDQIFLGELYQIRELSGKLVQEGRINSNTNHIQLNDKAKGIYFLSIPNMNVQEKVVVY